MLPCSQARRAKPSCLEASASSDSGCGRRNSDETEKENSEYDSARTRTE